MVLSFHQALEVQELQSLATPWAWPGLRVPVCSPSSVGGSLRTVILLPTMLGESPGPIQEGPSYHGEGSSCRQLTGPLTAPRASRETGRKRGHRAAGSGPSSLPILSFPRPGAWLIHSPPPFFTGVGWGGGDETHDSSCPRGRAHLAPHSPILKTLGLLMIGGTERPGALSL